MGDYMDIRSSRAGLHLVLSNYSSGVKTSESMVLAIRIEKQKKIKSVRKTCRKLFFGNLYDVGTVSTRL